MYSKYLYMIGAVIFLVGSLRIFILKKFEFRYYSALELGNYLYILSMIFSQYDFFILAIYFFYLYKKQ